MDKTDLLQKMEAGEFSRNNGLVLRTINIIEGTYMDLGTLRYAMPDVSSGDIRKAVNYLEMENYIIIRDKQSRETTSISDSDINDLEAKVSGRGLKILRGRESDPDVEM